MVRQLARHMCAWVSAPKDLTFALLSPAKSKACDLLELCDLHGVCYGSAKMNSEAMKLFKSPIQFLVYFGKHFLGRSKPPNTSLNIASMKLKKQIGRSRNTCSSREIRLQTNAPPSNSTNGFASLGLHENWALYCGRQWWRAEMRCSNRITLMQLKALDQVSQPSSGFRYFLKTLKRAN